MSLIVKKNIALRTFWSLVTSSFFLVSALQVEARAAGSSYSGGTVAGPGGATLPITRVVTVTSAGTVQSIPTDDGTLSVAVPSGAFSETVQLVVANSTSAYSTPIANRTPTASFLVAFYNDGVKITGNFAKPVRVSFRFPAIHQGDIVMVRSGSLWTRANAAIVRDGYVSLDITSDPVIAVLGAKSQAFPILLPGTSSRSVATLQRYLNSRGSQLAVDGIFGAWTQKAVKRIQVRNHMIANAIVGPRTWAVISRTAPHQYPTVSLGMKTPAVNVLRELLFKRGYKIAKYGKFDQSLNSAVKAFQRAHDLKVNGIVRRLFWLRIGVQ